MPGPEPRLEHKDERLHAAESGALGHADLTAVDATDHPDGPLEGADWRDRLAALRDRLERPSEQPT